jgi:transcription elongation factor GreA-like protein
VVVEICDGVLPYVFFFSTIIFLIVGLIAYSYRHGGVTVLAVNPEIVILHDGQQEAIVEEIMKRRRLMMKSKMAQVDTHQPYYEEASKFSWLKEEEVVSQEEYAQACEKIAVMRDKALFGERGNMRQGLDKDTTGK